MRNIIIVKDDQGVNVSVELKSFLKHIQKYHNSGISIHEGKFFTVNDSFRKMLKENNKKSVLKDTYEGDGTEWIIEKMRTVEFIVELWGQIKES